jgi:hypothetical protein
MHITDQTHPKLCEALRLMIHDHGGNHRFNPDQNQPSGFNVPSHLDKQIDAAERGLSKLDGDQMDTFASGEQTEMESLIATDPDLSDAHTILNHCFDNYTDGVWLAE